MRGYPRHDWHRLTALGQVHAARHLCRHRPDRMLGGWQTRCFRMTTGHLVRWTVIYGILVGFWTWWVLTETSVAARILGAVAGLLALRGLAGSIIAFVRRPSLTLGPDALTVSDVVRARDVRWDECSAFRPSRAVLNGHVRWRAGQRRRSLPAGFGDTDRRLTANELANVLNRARDMSSGGLDPAGHS